MKAMVLAAGVGSRLDPLTARVPKPLVPVANKPVMDHILDLLKANQFNEIIANLHYKPDLIKDRYGRGTDWGVDLTFRYEETLSGDAGGVRACREFLEGDTFCVIMGDLITDCDLSAIVRAHKEKGALATIAVKQVSNVEQFGVVLQDQNGFIKGFQEKPSQEEALSDMASAGIYILEPSIFEYFPKSESFGFGRQLFPRLVDEGKRVLAVAIENYWSDVGTINQYRQSNIDALHERIKLELKGERKNNSWIEKDTKIADDIKISGRFIIGAGSTVDEGVKLNGSVIIGDNCHIGPGVEIENSVIWSGTTIGDHSRITDSIIGLNSNLEKDSELKGKAIQNHESREFTTC